MIPIEICCREFVEFLDDYLAGAHSGARRAEFDAHLAICPPCVAYMETYRATVQLGRAALGRSQDPVPDEVPERLVRAILEARRKS